jgi:hypothetical protein
MLLGKLDIHMQKAEIRTYLSSWIKINSKGIKYLNVRVETLKLLQKTQGKHLKLEA